MTFPTTGILDTFNRANEGPPPSASWAGPAWNGSGELVVNTNQCARNGAGYGDDYWNVATFGPDCEVYADIPTLPVAGEEVSLYLRARQPGAGGLDGYAVYLVKIAGAANDIVRIYRIDNEALTQLGANITQEFSAGDSLGFEAEGSTLRVYRKSGGVWTELGSRADATYLAAGYIGAEIQNTTCRLDNFGGGTTVTAVTPSPFVWTGGPTIPSLHETLGLSVAYADPLVKSPRSAYLGELRQEVNSYEHETAAIGGYLTARFDLSGDMVDVNDWFERGLGRHIEVTGPDLQVVWEGFVNSVAVNAGQYAATRGPLVEIANRVYAVYSERDTSVDPPTTIPGQVTTIAQDTVSQGKYGIWEKRISAGEDTALGAQRQRDSFLRENKEPTTDDPRIVLEAGGQVSVAVECLGYWAWLLAYPYLDTAASGTVTAQTKVQYILAADTNGIFSVNYSHVGYNPDLAPRYENSGTPAWEVAKALTARGDANDNRWLFGVYAGREAYYRQAPTVEKYQHRLADPAQRIETIIGDEVDPWDVQPGEWVYLPDFLTGRGQPIVAADKRDDPRFLFVEAVRYRAPYGAEITGTRVGKLAQILAKKGVGGGGG